MREMVVESKRDHRSGIITHTVDVEGKIEHRKYCGINAGLSWPTATSPGYYTILAEQSINEGATRFEGIEQPRGKLQLLLERSVKSLFLTDLASQLADDCNRLGAGGIFAEIEVAENGSFRDERACLFREFLQKAGCRASLQRAPYLNGTTGAGRVEDLGLSLAILSFWLQENRLELPEGSLAREQLRAVTREDLADPEGEPRLFAVRALGHAVALFHKSSPYGLAGRYRSPVSRRPYRR
jgi:hypothetical protein